MISLFSVNNYTIDTSIFSNLLHDDIVRQFEENFCDYVGAKYACSLNSASNAIFLSLFYNDDIKEVGVPSILPNVVINSIVNAQKGYKFIDDVSWVGDSYHLYESRDFKIIDSAHKVNKNQFKEEANDDDLMIFSFYPTKPISSCDGGIIVSNNKKKIDFFKEISFNGTSIRNESWERKYKYFGWKMYMNSIQAYIANENLKNLNYKRRKLKLFREYYNSKLGYQNKSDHLYRINVKDNSHFIKYMKDKGIQCGIHYKALHHEPLFSSINKDLPKSNEVSKTTVSLPFHENLKFKDINFIIESIEEYEEQNH